MIILICIFSVLSAILYFSVSEYYADAASTPKIVEKDIPVSKLTANEKKALDQHKKNQEKAKKQIEDELEKQYYWWAGAYLIVASQSNIDRMLNSGSDPRMSNCYKATPAKYKGDMRKAVFFCKHLWIQASYNAKRKGMCLYKGFWPEFIKNKNKEEFSREELDRLSKVFDAFHLAEASKTLSKPRSPGSIGITGSTPWDDVFFLTPIKWTGLFTKTKAVVPTIKTIAGKEAGKNLAKMLASSPALREKLGEAIREGVGEYGIEAGVNDYIIRFRYDTIEKEYKATRLNYRVQAENATAAPQTGVIKKTAETVKNAARKVLKDI